MPIVVFYIPPAVHEYLATHDTLHMILTLHGRRVVIPVEPDIANLFRYLDPGSGIELAIDQAEFTDRLSSHRPN